MDIFIHVRPLKTRLKKNVHKAKLLTFLDDFNVFLNLTRRFQTKKMKEKGLGRDEFVKICGNLQVSSDSFQAIMISLP